MPCHDYTDDYLRAEAEAKLRASNETACAAFKRLDEVTALLCEVCGRLEAAGQLGDVKLRLWWEDHKRRDSARKAAEARAALATLPFTGVAVWKDVVDGGPSGGEDKL